MKKFSVWARGYGDFAKIDNNGNAAGVDARSGGMIVGADARVARGIRVGLLSQFGKSDGEADARVSSLDANNHSIAAYAGYTTGPWLFKALAGYSHHNIETSRSIVFPGINRTATADYDADQVTLYGEGAYRIMMQQIAIMPTVALRWSQVDVDGFTETGAGAANLTVAGQNYDSLDTTVGVRIATSFRSQGINWLPQIRIGWTHASGDLTPSVGMSFAGGGAFTVAGATRAENSLTLGAGLNFSTGSNVTGFVDYSGNYADDSREHAVSGGFRVRF